MTLTGRLQGAALFFLFVILCYLFGRSILHESRADLQTPALESVMDVRALDEPPSNLQPSNLLKSKAQKLGTTSTEGAQLDASVGDTSAVGGSTSEGNDSADPK
jgi:hypothetical protein